MLSFFKNFFAKGEPKAASPVAVRSVPESSAAAPAVEVVQLSLAAIVERMAEDLKSLVQHPPMAEATVALPLQTILKQLPAGTVKMSLASLHRQAHGTFAALPAGDKRMVEVPLAEIFRHVSPHVLRRRADQRIAELPGNEFNLFGNPATPHTMAPCADPLPDAPSTRVLDLTPSPQRVLKMDDGLREHFNGAAAPKKTAAEPLPHEPAPLAFESSPKAAPAPTLAEPLVLSLAALCAAWPEEICQEIAGFESGTTVALPVAEITAGLAKGRVTFAWDTLRQSLTPPPPNASTTDATTVLSLPLKIVAPAFLAATHQAKIPRKTTAVDESIPSLFSGGTAAAEETPKQAPEPLPEAPAAEDPTAVPLRMAPVAPARPETVAQIFGEPERQEWTPAEIVQRTVKLAGVSGTVVALQEGLAVASVLPDGVKGDVVAAFLPQIFARLNQYSGEMKLGEVDDLLFTTHGAHCQIYRLGYVYFAVLGKPGEALPWHELRLIAAELARQTSK